MLLKPIAIGLLDDHTLFRKTLKNFLSDQADLEVALQSPDVSDLLTKLESTPVDLLLMDLFLPGSSGHEAVKIIQDQYPGIKIIILSMTTDLELISGLLDAGIHGFVSKGEEPEELLQTIYSVAAGRIYRTRLFTEALYYSKQQTYRQVTGSDLELTDRERKMLQLIWEEKSNREIATELFLGIRSIEKIRQEIKVKIGVRSTVGLLKYAIGKKLIGADLGQELSRG